MKQIRIAIVLSLFLISPVCAQKVFWHQTNGPLAGTLREITIDSTGNIIIWTSGSGVYRSTDNGNNWHLLNKGLPSLSMLRGAYSSSGYLFGENSFSPAFTQLFRFNEKTPNASWENITPFNGIYINDILALPNGSVFLAHARGILRSDDNGITWHYKNFHLRDSIDKITKDSNAIFLATDGKGILFTALQKGGIFRSSDNGESWTKLPLRDPDGQQINALAAAANGNIIIGNFGLNGLGIGGKIYVSSDTGKTWIPVYQRPADVQEHKNNIDKIVRDPRTNILYANAHGPTLSSTDNGVSWIETDSAKRGDEPFSVATYQNTLFQMSEPDGVFFSNDGGNTWTEKNNGLYAELIWDVAINSKQEVFAITEYGLHRSTDNGDSWDQAPEYGETYFPSIYIDQKDYLYIGTSFGLFRSKDNGNTLDHIIQISDSSTIIQVGKDRVGQKLYCSFSILDSNGFIYSTDNGDHWLPVLQLPVAGARIDAFAFATKDSVLLASGSSYYLSTNNGINWKVLSGISNLGTYKLLILEDGSYLSLIKNENGGVYRSTDGAQNWTKLFPPPEGFPNFNTFYSMMVDDSGRIIVCTDSGIYRSRDNQQFVSWDGVSTGMTAEDFPNHYISASAVVENPVSHVFFAGSRGLSVFKSVPDLDTSKAAVASNSLPTMNSLSTFPNPSQSAASISYTVESRSEIRLDVFDALGRHVKTLISGISDAVEHSALLDASLLTSGNYLVVLQSESGCVSTWITITK